MPCFGRKRQTQPRGLPLPGDLRLPARDTTSRRLVADQLEAFCENWRKVDLALRALEEPDAVRRADDRVDDREGGAGAASERPLVAAVIYNRLHDRMPLGIDATLRYGLHIPPTKSITQSQLAERQRRTTRASSPGLPPTPIANPGLASIQAAAHPAKVDYLYFVRKPDHMHHFFTASADRVRPVPGDARLWLTTRHVALLGHPVAHSLSPLMQNAAFAAAGSTGTTRPSTSRTSVAAVAALRTLGFAGANVTIPHKQAVVAACDEADGDAVNTLVFRDGRVLGFNTDREILAGIERDARLPDRRRRRGAHARAGAAGDTRVFSRPRRVAAGRRRAAT